MSRCFFCGVRQRNAQKFVLHEYFSLLTNNILASCSCRSRSCNRCLCLNSLIPILLRLGLGLISVTVVAAVRVNVFQWRIPKLRARIPARIRARIPARIRAKMSFLRYLFSNLSVRLGLESVRLGLFRLVLV